MFIEVEDLIEIKLYYKKRNNQSYIIFNEDEFKKEFVHKKYKDELDSFKTITIKANPLTWGLYNDIQDGAIFLDINGNQKWSNKKYLETKLLKIMASWDVKIPNEEGELKKAKIDLEIIRKLAPEIAKKILDTYDEKTQPEEDEKK